MELSNRAEARRHRLEAEFSWVSDDDALAIVRDEDGTERLWTFAGEDVNVWLSVGLGDLSAEGLPGDFSIRLSKDVEPMRVKEALMEITPDRLDLSDRVAQGAIDRLKFAEALPEELATEVATRRMRCDDLVRELSEWDLRRIVKT